MKGVDPEFDHLRKPDWDALFPRVPTRLRLWCHEFRSAVGRRGSQAAATFLLVVIVLGIGIFVAVLTWNEGHIPSLSTWWPNVTVSLVVALAVVLIVGLNSSRLRWRRLQVLGCLAALVLGIVVILTGTLGAFSTDDDLDPAAFWTVFVILIALTGSLLSSEVTKRWLRAFVATGLVIAALLLVTIGRNARVDEAQLTMGAEARPLLASWSEADVDAALDELEKTDPEAAADPADGTALDDRSQRVLVETALLDRMCDEGDIDDESNTTCEILRTTIVPLVCSGDEIDARYEQDCTGEDVDTLQWTTAQLDLRCLDGWTLAAITAWLDEASFDRRAAVLTALTSCEAGAVNPSAEAIAMESASSNVTSVVSQGDTDEDLPETTIASATDEGVEGDAPEEPGSLESADSTGIPDPDALAEATVRDALSIQRSELRLREAIASGADEILGQASGSTDFAEFRFSGAAWLTLLALTLLWYRHLEIRSGAHRLGPVDIQFERQVAPPSDKSKGNEVPKEKDEGGAAATVQQPERVAEAVFKESVIRNVPEPGAIPGAQALAPVGDLVAQTGVPHKWLIGAVIEAAQTIFATQGGYAVIFSSRRSDENETPPPDLTSGHEGSSSTANGGDTQEPNAESDAEPERNQHPPAKWVAFVRMHHIRTGAHVTSRVVESASEEDAARVAGYWIAGWIVDRSDYVPNWARWSEVDAATFARLALTGGENWDLASEIDPHELEPHVINAVILAHRAYAFQISPASPQSGERRDRRANHLGALEDFARAVNRQPRYPVARYRRGAVLGTMMRPEGSLDSAAGEDVGRVEAIADARLSYLFGDLILRDSLTLSCFEVLVPSWIERSKPASKDSQNGTDQAAPDVPDGRPFPPSMRSVMLRVVAEWSNRNRMWSKLGWAARLRPTERHFWREFNEGNLRRDWRWVLKTDLCICAERLELDANERPSGNPDFSAEKMKGIVHASTRSRWWKWRCRRKLGKSHQDKEVSGLRRRVCEFRLKRIEKGARRRAEQAESHWQISYNLACLYSIRSRCRDEEANGPCQVEALAWLERSLDRRASSQLVQEWVEADDDLNAIREHPNFECWKQRLRSITPSSQEDGRHGRDQHEPESMTTRVDIDGQSTSNHTPS